jgi:BA14K-like protein
MTSLVQSTLSAAICAATFIIAAPPVNATPAGGIARSLDLTVQSSSLLDHAQYRGQYYGRRHNGYAGNRYRRNNSARNLALGIGGLVIGGIVLSDSARSEHRHVHGSDWQRCAQTYRSFEPETGMYTGYDGIRRTCPYLR